MATLAAVHELSAELDELERAVTKSERAAAYYYQVATQAEADNERIKASIARMMEANGDLEDALAAVGVPTSAVPAQKGHRQRRR